MDILPTQVFEDNDFTPTQRLSHSLLHDATREDIQIGVLNIGANTYAIKKGINIIGRHPDCHIILNDQTISKRHAEIEASSHDATVWICDLNSSNKTKLNSSILRPHRCYELKDGSVLMFGMVCAIYKVHRVMDESLIPETPAPTRQGKQLVIPGTPDSSLNNSSTLGENISTIPGTQAGNESGKESVFQRPLPLGRNSTSSRKSFIQDSSAEDSSLDYSRSFTIRGKERVGESRSSIHDIETLKSSDSQNETNVDIHDVETQRIFLNRIRPNQQDNIHDMETQRNEDVETQASFTDLHTVETQLNVDIHDMKTPRKINILNSSTKNPNSSVQDVEKQETKETEITEEKESNIYNRKTQKIELNKSKSCTSDANDHEDEYERLSKKVTPVKDADATDKNIQKSPQEFLQLSLTTNFEDEPSDLDRSYNLHGSQNLLENFVEDNDTSDEEQSKSSTPIKSLRQNNNKIIEKSSDEENIFDTATNAKPDDENIFEAVTQRINFPFKTSQTVDDSDETDQEAVFQRYSRISSQDSTQPSKSQSVVNEDSDTDEEGRFAEMALVEKRASCSFETRYSENKEVKNDARSSKDSDDLFDIPTQRIHREKNENTSVKRVVYDKVDVDFDMPTQVIDTKKFKNDTRTEQNTEIKEEIDDLAATQILPRSESSTKVNEPSVNVTTRKAASSKEVEDITAIEDNMATPILSTSKKVSDTNDNDSSKSSDLNPNPVERCSIEDIDYEMAPTQLLNETVNNESTSVSSKNTLKRSNKANLNDTLEKNLNEMFDDVNEERLEVEPQISTQVLTDILQLSQSEQGSKDKPNEGNKSPEISTTAKFRRGRKSKAQVNLTLSHVTLDKESRKSDLKNKTIDADVQESQTYFSTLISKRKRNILVDSQVSIDLVENIADNKKEKELVISSETVTISDENNSISGLFKSTPKGSSTPIVGGLSRGHKIEELKVILEKTDLSKSNTSMPDESSKQVNEEKSKTTVDTEQFQRTSTILKDDDEDILAGLPEVRISGTLSNPASPTSSTSSEFKLKANRISSKQRSKKELAPKRGRPARKAVQKSVTRINAENAAPYRTISKPDPTVLLKNISSFDIEKASVKVHESDVEKVNKASKPVTRKISSERSRKSEKTESVVQQKSVPLVNTQEQTSSSPIQRNRRTDNFSKENVDRSSVFQVGKEAPVANAGLAKRVVLNTPRVGKRSLNSTDVVESSNVKKRKQDVNEDTSVSTKQIKRNTKGTIVNRRNSANILDYMTKRNSSVDVKTSNETMPPFNQSSIPSKNLMIKMTRISPNTITESKTEDTVSTETKRTRRTSTNNQTYLKNNSENMKNEKVGQNVDKRRNTSRRTINKRQGEIGEISSQVGEESQEVEMIMNTSLKIRATTLDAGTKEDTSRSIKNTRTRNSRKRENAYAHTDTESSVSSDLYESDNAHFEIPTSKAKRAKVSKNASMATDDKINKPIITRPKRNNKETYRSTRSRQQSITDRSSADECEEANASRISTNNTVSRVKSPKKRSRKKKVEQVETDKKQTEDFIEENSSSDRNTSFGNVSVFSTPSRARRSMSSFSASSPFKMKHKILFTGISNNDYNKLLVKLGASQVENPTNCTVLVTDKVRRTVKFLCALAQSVPIVSVDWLTESEKAGRFVQLENYILKDPAAEAKFGFKLRKSIEKAKEHKLLEGYSIVLTPNVTSPPLSELKTIISSCGGKALVRPPPSWPQKAVIISTEQDLANAKKFLAKAPKTVTIQSTEFILTGILRQELEFVKYKLT